MRQQADIKALNDAKLILERLIIDIGIMSDGWGVDILSHALAHLLYKSASRQKFPIPADLMDSWSAVEQWDKGVIRALPKPHTTIQ